MCVCVRVCVHALSFDPDVEASLLLTARVGVSGSTRMEVQGSVSPAEVHSEDDQGCEMESEEDRQNWQSLVSLGVLASLTPQEIKRQEVINGDRRFILT